MFKKNAATLRQTITTEHTQNTKLYRNKRVLVPDCCLQSGRFKDSGWRPGLRHDLLTAANCNFCCCDCNYLRLRLPRELYGQAPRSEDFHGGGQRLVAWIHVFEYRLWRKRCWGSRIQPVRSTMTNWSVLQQLQWILTSILQLSCSYHVSTTQLYDL